MEKQSKGYLQTREIDIRKMIFVVLKKWRTIMLFALIGAVVLTGWQYYRDYTNAKKEAQDKISSLEYENTTTEELSQNLDDLERQGVMNAIKYRILLDEYNEYMEESILMQINPYEERVVSLNFQLSGMDTENAISEIYGMVKSCSTIEEICADINYEENTKYIEELIQVEVVQKTIQITVLGDTEERASGIAEALENIVKEYVTKLAESGLDISLQDIEQRNEIVVDLELLTNKSEVLNAMHLNNSYFANYYNNFRDDQKILYERLTDAETVEEPSGKLSEEQKEILIAEYSDIHVTVNKKMVILGIISGILLAVVLNAILYTFSGNIHGADEVRYLFNSRVLGDINLSHLQKKKWSVRKGERYEQQLCLLVANIYLSCKNLGISRVYLSGSKIECIPIKFIEQMKTCLAEKKIEVVSGKDIIHEADSLMELAENGTAIFVEIDERSNCEEIRKELELCAQNQIRTLGVIMVQQ
ncbi:MAG: hypothetical protein PUB52_10360 [Lachnospiraceae bacterium]|nr:hypothetical protein [Lachnospiraceae bacterium]